MGIIVSELVVKECVCMINSDTVKLLRECDAGIKMGRNAINDVLGYVKDEKLGKILSQSEEWHAQLNREIENALERFGDEGKRPSSMASGMSAFKTNVKLTLDGNSDTVAEIIYDGCGMGIKSLSRYLNKYQAADGDSKDIARRLIELERKLSEAMLVYL